MTWEDSIRGISNALTEIRNSQVRLRHNMLGVAVSKLADQYYCEMKVEQEYVHGEVEKEEKTIGSVLHEELIPLVPTELDEFIQNVKKKPLYIVSFPMLAKYQNVVITGKPDAVVFQKSIPSHLIELKTTRGNPNIWPQHRVQSQVYAFLMDKMGFDCSRLETVIASVKQQAEFDKSTFLEYVIVAILSKKKEELEAKIGCKVCLEAYDRNYAMNKIDWAMDYWLIKRNPIPTKMAGKCRTCEYADSCPANQL